MSGAIGDIAAKMTGDDEFQEDRRRSDTWGQSLEGAAKVGQVYVHMHDCTCVASVNR